MFLWWPEMLIVFIKVKKVYILSSEKAIRQKKFIIIQRNHISSRYLLYNVDLSLGPSENLLRKKIGGMFDLTLWEWNLTNVKYYKSDLWPGFKTRKFCPVLPYLFPLCSCKNRLYLRYKQNLHLVKINGMYSIEYIYRNWFFSGWN